jgi:hypothetical protein
MKKGLQVFVFVLGAIGTIATAAWAVIRYSHHEPMLAGLAAATLFIWLFFYALYKHREKNEATKQRDFFVALARYAADNSSYGREFHRWFAGDLLRKINLATGLKFDDLAPDELSAEKPPSFLEMVQGEWMRKYGPHGGGL